MLVECDCSLYFLIALFLAFFEKKNYGNIQTIHEKNWRLDSVVAKQKMNVVVIEQIKQKD